MVFLLNGTHGKISAPSAYTEHHSEKQQKFLQMMIHCLFLTKSIRILMRKDGMQSGTVPNSVF